MKKILALGILVSLSLNVSADPIKEGMKIYGKTCVECHGDNGKDTSIAPKAIAGGDILAMLTGYKNGTFGGAQKETMQASLAALSPDDLKAVAAYVKTLQ